jgi:hypothetical protein
MIGFISGEPKNMRLVYMLTLNQVERGQQESSKSKQRAQILNREEVRQDLISYIESKTNSLDLKLMKR